MGIGVILIILVHEYEIRIMSDKIEEYFA